MRASWFVALAAGAIGCTTAPAPTHESPASPPPSPSLSQPEVPVTPTALPSAIATATLVFEGHVQSLGVAPNAWSGMLAIYQPVTWSVTRVLRGDAALAGTQVTVQHPLVMGSPSAATGTPGLNATMFAVGATWLVFASPQQGQLTCSSERDGVVAATPAIEAAVTASHP